MDFARLTTNVDVVHLLRDIPSPTIVDNFDAMQTK